MFSGIKQSESQTAEVPGENTTFCQGLLYCGGYFLCIAITAVIGHTAFESSPYYISGAALVSVIIAFRFSLKSKFFHKEAVDALYYSAGIIGVLVFFAHQSIERFELEQTTALKSIGKSHIEALDQLENFELTVSQMQKLLSIVSENTNAFLREARRVEVNATTRLSPEDAAACGRAMVFQVQLDDTQTRQEIFQQQIQRELDSQACDKATQALGVERNLQISQQINLEHIMKNADAFRNYGSGTIVIGSNSFELSEIVRALTDFQDAASTNEERAKLESAVHKTKKAFDEGKSAISSNITEEKQKSSTVLGMLSLYFWPYVLIFLLSLKIARPMKVSC
ncbi:hypothetical protein [Pelagibius sp. Alg239-R121]|uniref:hypothetical protein n=1 Tax=Pelagibius sp. Alg239-R121 TaxID=2993448 RepID=UPI0024A6308C|nr:hypothetical protein [Pelagibius sp. Alg239-R121]